MESWPGPFCMALTHASHIWHLPSLRLKLLAAMPAEFHLHFWGCWADKPWASCCVPAGCTRLTSLVKLQASFNCFTALPPCLAHLPKLEMARCAGAAGASKGAALADLNDDYLAAALRTMCQARLATSIERADTRLLYGTCTMPPSGGTTC